MPMCIPCNFAFRINIHVSGSASAFVTYFLFATATSVAIFTPWIWTWFSHGKRYRMREAGALPFPFYRMDIADANFVYRYPPCADFKRPNAFPPRRSIADPSSTVEIENVKDARKTRITISSDNGVIRNRMKTNVHQRKSRKTPKPAAINSGNRQDDFRKRKPSEKEADARHRWINILSGETRPWNR